MKSLIKYIINNFGYEIKKKKTLKICEIGSPFRPVGQINFLLEDLKKRGLNCKSILDVGANRTEWSRMAKKIYPDAQFNLIEPQTEMIHELEKFCEEFIESKYFLNGAGAKKETRIFTIWDDLEGSSFLPKPSETLKLANKQREIEVITINDLIFNSLINIPDLIKLDIQGFEIEALKGATKTFGHTEVYIIEVSLFPFEGNPEFAEIINYMSEIGYVVYDFPGFLRRPYDGALAQCDICFVKEAGELRKSNRWN